MLGELFRKLFAHREPTSKKGGRPQPPPDSEPGEASIQPLSPRIIAPRLVPIDLDIGLDIGTSCTKAVLGDREANKQTAVPLNQGRDLRGYILPSRVYLAAGVYSLEGSPGSVAKCNLKMRIMQATTHGHATDRDAQCDLAAFSALALRRILGWYKHALAETHPNREPIWHLNVGLPSRGGSGDPFAPIYEEVMGAAANLASGEKPITRDRVESLIGHGSSGVAGLSGIQLNTFPEAGAQLASLIFSPYRPTGCLLVVDVGAGTMDISTLRIGVNANGPRCTIHCCKIAPLGVHYLHLARRGFRSEDGNFREALVHIPDDDGVSPLPGGGRIAAPPAFTEKCRDAILPTVSQYRRRLKAAHANQAFRPWRDGLPYVLSGGGHRDPFYMDLLKVRLEQWLSTICSEWDSTFTGTSQRKLILKSFPEPRSFGPKNLLPNFDRFSVAHGLSLGVDGLMEMRDVSDRP